MTEKKNISYNAYFFIPFLLWIVAGGVVQLFISKEALFHAVNTNSTNWADFLFLYITWMGQAEVIIPILVLLMLLPRNRNLWFFFTAALCNLVPFFIQQALKSIFDRPRPRLLYYDRLWMHYLPDWPEYLSRSFPSGHSTGAFSFFCFLALLLPQRHRYFGLLFFILALSVCYSRMYLAAHFFEDVYAGSIVGAGVTTFVFVIMSKYKSSLIKKHEV